jgi:hypothetical protein
MESKMQMVKYTLVRHSAWSIAQKPEFERAVELRELTAKQVGAVAKVGGLIFNSYDEADDRETAENYPPDVVGLIPRAAGTFRVVAGLDVYLPDAGEQQ